MKRALVIALACTGCPSKKEDAPAAPPAPPVHVAPPIAQPQVAPPAPVLPAQPETSPNALTCALIFPQPLRDKYFHGIEVRDRPMPGPANAECEIGAGDRRALLSVTCGDGIPDAMAPMIKLRIERMHGKPLAVGKGGVLMQNANGHHAVVWDDDSSCQAQFEVPHGIDAAAFAKDVLAVLPVR